MSTQSVTRLKTHEATIVTDHTDVHIQIAEQPTGAYAAGDPTREAALQHVRDMPGMRPELQQFYMRVLPPGCAPVGCRPFYPCP